MSNYTAMVKSSKYTGVAASLLCVVFLVSCGGSDEEAERDLSETADVSQPLTVVESADPVTITEQQTVIADDNSESLTRQVFADQATDGAASPDVLAEVVLTKEFEDMTPPIATFDVELVGTFELIETQAGETVVQAAEPDTQSETPNQEATSQTDTAAVLDQPEAVADAPVTAIDWLDRFEARGNEIKTLQANLVHTKENTLLGDTQTRIGQLNYAAGDNPDVPAANGDQHTPARFAIRINQRVLDDRVHNTTLDFIFDGEVLGKCSDDRLKLRLEIT